MNIISLVYPRVTRKIYRLINSLVYFALKYVMSCLVKLEKSGKKRMLLSLVHKQKLMSPANRIKGMAVIDTN